MPDAVLERVPDRRASHSKSPAAIRAETVTRYDQKTSTDSNNITTASTTTFGMCEMFTRLVPFLQSPNQPCQGTERIILMKKALRETQTRRAGCSKAKPKIFAPPQTPFPEDGQNLISWRWSLTTFTYRPSLVRIDARNFELS